MLAGPGDHCTSCFWTILYNPAFIQGSLPEPDSAREIPKPLDLSDVPYEFRPRIVATDNARSDFLSFGV